MINSPIDEIKNKLDIVEVIQGYIKLEKAGANFRAPCPFHSEKKPSFFVSPARQIWHCFGCGKGGNIFNFVMEIEGMEFGDALRLLAQKAGIELRKQDPQIVTQKQHLYEICEIAAQFFETQLEKSKIGQEVKEYLLNRGIKKESIEKWRIGYAPDVWEGLSNFLMGKEYKREEIINAGLAVKKENQNNYLDSYDRFRRRIMFPIFDLNGQVVGFTGRIFEKQDKEETAKYVNTPSTLLYDKSRILYGLDKAKISIRKENKCILVEGQTDVIMSHQVGNENVIATSGTALTPYQLTILKRYTENLITGFDMDSAGDSATKRGIELAQEQGFNIKVIAMPENLDPADVISKNPDDWEKMIENSKSILEFYFDSAFSKDNSKTPEGKKNIAKALLPILKKIPNKIEQFHWIQKMAQKLEAREQDIQDELKKIVVQPVQVAQPVQAVEVGIDIFSNNKNGAGRKQILEQRILSLVLMSEENLHYIDENLISLLSIRTQEILNNLKKDFDFFKKPEITQELKDFLDTLSLKQEIEQENIDYEKEIQICAGEIKIMETKNRLDAISREIKKAEQEKNTEKVDLLTREFEKTCSGLNNTN